MIKLLRQFRHFIRFQPSTTPAQRLTATEAKAGEEYFKSSGGRKLDELINLYVTDCAVAACSKFGDEGSYRNGWAMGAAGLRAFIKAQFRNPQAQEGTDIEDESGIPDELT